MVGKSVYQKNNLTEIHNVAISHLFTPCVISANDIAFHIEKAFRPSAATI
jgi:hypothetical protein